MNERRWQLLWVGWLGVILSLTIIYSNVFVGHSHWMLVQWLPSKGTGTWAEYGLDVVGNVLLFLPLGYAQGPAGLILTRRLLLSIGLTSLLLSMGIELFQVYSHNRLASTSDLFANTLGGLLGGLVYERLVAPSRHAISTRSLHTPALSDSDSHTL